MTNPESSKKRQKADPNYPYWSYQNEAGEIVYSVPLEAPDDQTLEEPAEAEDELTYTYIRFRGGKPMRVHFVETTSRNAAYEQCSWLNTQHTQERRYGERYQLLSPSGSTDPGEYVWDYSPKMHRNEDGFTVADYSDLPDRIEEEIREQLPTSDYYHLVYRLSVIGMEPKHIGETLGIDQAMVYYYRKEALKIAQNYRKKFFDEGPYVFPGSQHTQHKHQRKMKE